MNVNVNTLSAISQSYVQETQESVHAETGTQVTPSQVIDTIIRSHCALTELFEVDATLLAAAVECLFLQDQDHIISEFARTVGEESGYWRTATPAILATESIPSASFADALRAKAAEVATQEGKSVGR